MENGSSSLEEVLLSFLPHSASPEDTQSPSIQQAQYEFTALLTGVWEGRENPVFSKVWKQGLSVLAKIFLVTPPFDLHLAVQSIVPQVFVHEEEEEEDDDYSKWCRRLVVLQIWTRILQQCPTNPCRPKRWLSVTWQIIRFVQSHVVIQKGVIPITDNDKEFRAFQSIVTNLWFDTVSPAIRTVFTRAPQDPARSVAFVAAMVRTGLLLVVGRTTTIDDSIYQELYSSCNEDIVSVTLSDSLWEILAAFPRRRRIQSFELWDTATTSLEHKLWVYYTVLDPNDSDDDSENNESLPLLLRPSGELEFVETTWVDQSSSLAMLMASSYATDHRPATLSPAYLWQCYFPHVESMLEAGWVVPAMDLLQHLLRGTPTESLPTPPNDKDPAYPIGTLLLLGNHLVHTSMTNKKIGSSSNGVSASPSVGHIYATMQDILAKYNNPVVAYLDFVPSLIHSCPHAGLVPKLIDLWRRPVARSTVDATLARKLWFLLNEQYVIPLREKYTTPDGQSIRNTEELAVVSETYVAVLGLMHSWFLLSSNTLPIEETLTQNRDQLLVVQIALKQTVGDSIEQDYARFYLLQETLDRVLSAWPAKNGRG